MHCRDEAEHRYQNGISYGERQAWIGFGGVFGGDVLMIHRISVHLPWVRIGLLWLEELARVSRMGVIYWAHGRIQLWYH